MSTTDKWIVHPHDIDIDVNGLNCCAWQEIHGIQGVSDQRQTLLKVGYKRFWYGDMCAQYLFTEAVGTKKAVPKHGLALVALIEELDIGTVEKLEVVENPNTDNFIHSWVWRTNQEQAHRFRSWYNAVKLPEPNGVNWIKPMYAQS